jgi:hypothetical protein
MSTLATAGAGAVIVRDPLRRALRRALRRRRAQPRRLLHAYRLAAAAPPTLSAAAEFATVAWASAGIAELRAAPAPPTLSLSAAAISAIQTEPVASSARGASPMMTAVAGSAASTAVASVDRFLNGFPCTRSGRDGPYRAGAPSPSLCPYSPECVEYEFSEVQYSLGPLCGGTLRTGTIV